MSEYEKTQQLAADAMHTRDVVAKRYASGSEDDKRIALALNEAALVMFVTALGQMREPGAGAPVGIIRMMLAYAIEIGREIGDPESSAAAEELLASLNASRAPEPANE